MFNQKVQAVLDHVASAYGHNGSSVYRADVVGGEALGMVDVNTEHDLDAITESVLERLRVDAQFASMVAEQLGLSGGASLRTVPEIIDNDEDFAVEFKSTARSGMTCARAN